MSSFLGWMFLFIGLSAFFDGGGIGGALLFFALAMTFFRKSTGKEYKSAKSKGLNISKSKLTKFNKAMRLYFETKDELKLNDNIVLRPKNLAKNSNVELDVYYDNEYICEFSEFSEYFSGTYAKMIDEILEETSKHEDEYVVKSEVKAKEVVKEFKNDDETIIDKNNAAYYIKVIDDLNIEIRKEEITNGLYQTTAMLKQISMIESKYPENKDKLTKLYQYYLPILVNILNSYVKLINSNSKHDEIDKIETKLRKTIILVNEALKTITMQLCEEDIIDLNSDMSVLETILRKDGLVKSGTIHETEGSVSANGK